MSIIKASLLSTLISFTILFLYRMPDIVNVFEINLFFAIVLLIVINIFSYKLIPKIKKISLIHYLGIGVLIFYFVSNYFFVFEYLRDYKPRGISFESTLEKDEKYKKKLEEYNFFHVTKSHEIASNILRKNGGSPSAVWKDMSFINTSYVFLSIITQTSFTLLFFTFLITGNHIINPLDDMNQSIIEQVRSLIRQDRLKQAIELLLQFETSLSRQDRDDISMQSARLVEVVRKSNNGLIDYRERDLRMAEIRMALLNFLNNLEDFIDKRINKDSTEEIEKIIGTNNLQDIASLKAKIQWLEKGLKASKSVCKIEVDGGSGTGFIGTYKGEKYLFSNWHVLKTKDMAARAKVIFNYETDSSGQYKQTKEYDLDTDNYISSPYGQGDNDLDYVRVKVKDLGEEWGTLDFNINFSLPVNGEKAPIAIIQHPKGDPKKISIVDANVEDVKRGFRVYHTADTEYGSSGSPIFDKDWNVIALHHAREIDKDLNKGILFSRIFKDMEDKDASTIAI